MIKFWLIMVLAASNLLLSADVQLGKREEILHNYPEKALIIDMDLLGADFLWVDMFYKPRGALDDPEFVVSTIDIGSIPTLTARFVKTIEAARAKNYLIVFHKNTEWGEELYDLLTHSVSGYANAIFLTTTKETGDLSLIKYYFKNKTCNMHISICGLPIDDGIFHALDSSKNVFVVMDMQNFRDAPGWIDRLYQISTSTNPQAAPMLMANILKAIYQAKADGKLIVFIKYGLAGAAQYKPFVRAVADYRNVLFVTKTKNDGAEALVHALADHNLKPAQIEVCGINTEACIRETIGSLAHTYHEYFESILVLADLCATSTHKTLKGVVHTTALRDMAKMPKVQVIPKKSLEFDFTE